MTLMTVRRMRILGLDFNQPKHDTALINPDHIVTATADGKFTQLKFVNGDSMVVEGSVADVFAAVKASTP
jgi:hypothetical protein